MFKNLLATILAYLFLSNILFAEVVKDVEIIGNKRLSKETIEVIGKIEKNSNYNEERINILLKTA